MVALITNYTIKTILIFRKVKPRHCLHRRKSDNITDIDFAAGNLSVCTRWQVEICRRSLSTLFQKVMRVSEPQSPSAYPRRKLECHLSLSTSAWSDQNTIFGFQCRRNRRFLIVVQADVAVKIPLLERVNAIFNPLKIRFHFKNIMKTTKR